MPTMTAVAYRRFRKRLDAFLARTAQEAVIITLSNGQDRVLISRQEYESLLETAHLLSTGANAARLQGAVPEIEPIA